MWDQSGYDNAGGFVESGTQANTPGGEKRKRAQNLCPIKINDIQLAEEDGIKIEGREIGMVSVIGQVKTVEQTATKTVYTVEDNSGSIEAVHWTDADASDGIASGVSEGMNGRFIGSVRSQQGKKHIMVFKVLPVETKEELKAHELECLYVKLKLKQLNDKETQAIGGGGSQAGLPNSMIGSNSTGASQMSTTSFGNSKQDSVFKILSACTREEGMSRDEVMQSLKGRVSKKELDDALEYLSGEGHIYSTTDEDHFKTTDG